MSDPGRTNYDSKIFDVAPWSGAAGPDYTRVFKPDWTAVSRRKTDEYGSWHEHLQGKLPGCSPPATAAQLALDPLHINAPVPFGAAANTVDGRKERTAWRNRENQIVASLRLHVLKLPALQEAIDNHVRAWEERDYAANCPLLDSSTACALI